MGSVTRRLADFPGCYNLIENLVKAFRNVPVRVMLPHFPEVADIADVVSFTSLVNVLPIHRATCQSFNPGEGFKN